MELREQAITPDGAQNQSGRCSAIDGRTTRHLGDAIPQRIRKRIEEAFGWAKMAAGLRKLRHRGLPKVDWQFALPIAALSCPSAQTACPHRAMTALLGRRRPGRSSPTVLSAAGSPSRPRSLNHRCDNVAKHQVPNFNHFSAAF